MPRFAILLGLTLLPLVASDAPDFMMWPKGVPPGGIKVTAKYPNHLMMISHRDKDGIAEYHEKQTDIMVIQTGTATLVTGGEVVDPKTTAPGEIRGPSIKNGTKHVVGPGDVVHVPSKTPHQFFVKPGTEITYFVVKVDNP